MMFYKNFLKTVKKCPFCNNSNRIISENKHAFLTYALAPYSSHHLLVIPKRHVKSFTDLRSAENKDIDELLKLGIKLIHRYGYKNCTILMRDAGKMRSVEHLHYHIIPNHRIGDFNIKGKRRRVLEEKEISRIMNDMEKCFNNLGK